MSKYDLYQNCEDPTFKQKMKEKMEAIENFCEKIPKQYDCFVMHTSSKTGLLKNLKKKIKEKNFKLKKNKKEKMLSCFLKKYQKESSRKWDTLFMIQSGVQQ